MLQIIVALLAGLVFGIGLIVSGMVNPAKVIGFLDVAGDWDPTLALVMGGALAVSIPCFRWARGRERPIWSSKFQWPSKQDLDARLLSGAAIFGIGWGLAGICPGPAITALNSGLPPVLLFVGAMLAGSALYQFTLGREG